MIEELATAFIGIGILGVAFLVNVISALANVFGSHTEEEFSWSKFFTGVVQALLWSLSVLGCVAAINLFGWFTERLGLDITSFLDGLQTSTIILIVLGATAGYIISARENIEFFIMNKNKKYVDASNLDKDLDYEAVFADAKKFAEMIMPKHALEDAQTADDANPEEEVGKGASVNPLTRRLPDGDNDNGKGWQCSKYSYYLATGIRMNYKPHPDYGPCNGRDMVNYLIKNCGYKKCSKRNGAIFSYDAGKYGHTGMVLDANKNLVNDANWSPLRVGTHYINLEAVGATYCCPPDMLDPVPPAPKPTPTPAPTPAPKPTPTPAKPASFKVGDTVVPTRLVDYDGRKLRQYDKTYTITELIGNRAVLCAKRNGKDVVWAAMNTSDIKKA